jgi:hypothetical protein
MFALTQCVRQLVSEEQGGAAPPDWRSSVGTPYTLNPVDPQRLKAHGFSTLVPMK